MQLDIGQSEFCPQCGTAGEPEQDGPATYFSCPECGAEFGYAVRSEVQFCAAGLVEVPGPQFAGSNSVFLGTTIKRRPQ